MAHNCTLSRLRQRRGITVIPSQRYEAEPSTPGGARTPGETQCSRSHQQSATERADESARCVQSQHELLRPAEAARLLNVTPRCLQDWRLKGAGPRFIQMSPKLVHYRRSDLENFIRESAA